MAHGDLMESCPREEKWSVTIFVFYMCHLFDHLLLLQENINKGLKVVHDQVRCHSGVMLIPLRSKFSCPHLEIKQN